MSAVLDFKSRIDFENRSSRDIERGRARSKIDCYQERPCGEGMTDGFSRMMDEKSAIVQSDIA